MDKTKSFEMLMSGLKKLNSESQTEFYKKWSSYVISLASKNIDNGVRHKIDPEELIQTVMNAFMVGVGDGKFDYLENWGMVHATLTTITTRKCMNKIRNIKTKKNNHEMEVSSDYTGQDFLSLSEKNSPDMEMCFNELIDGIERLLNDTERLVFRMLLTGSTNDECALKVSRTVRHIERIKKKIFDLVKFESTR